MAVELDFKIEDAAFQAALREYAASQNKEWGAVIKAQARLLCINLAIGTHPSGKSGNFSPDGRYSGEKDKLSGENRIIGELFGGAVAIWGGAKNYKYNGIFAMVDDMQIEMAAKDKKGRPRKADWAIRVFTRKDGTIYGTESHLFRPNASTSEMHKFHKKYRQSGNGRITTAGLKTRDIGRWKFVDKMLVSEGSMNRYKKFILKRVGFGKGGWAAAARAIGGTRGLPQWVTRHKATGSAVDNSQSLSNPSVTIINSVSYISKICTPYQMARAMAYQRGKMLASMEKAASAQAAKFNRRK